jgi:hypothetical protein
MGIWDGIEDAEIFDRGNYVKPGFHGTVEVKKTIAKNTRQSGLAFICEMVVLTTNMPEAHPIGQKVTWFVKLANKDTAFPNVAAWAAACAGFDPHDRENVKTNVMPLLKDLMNHATDNPDDNEFVGQKLKLETVATLTKDKRDFTRYDFMPAIEQLAA